MSIRNGLDDRYDINIFNSDAWKIAYEYVTKAYVEDNFAGLYSSNLFRGFNYFQNGLSWSAGVLQTDGSILLSDSSGNTITINKSKFDTIDASLNDLTLNKASKQDITDAINKVIDGSPAALDTLKEISTALNNDPSFSTTIINTLATKAPINNPTFTGTVSGITKSMVGLTNVDNTTDLSKPISTATQAALNLKANISNPTFTGTVSGITKSMVGLANVDNTADIDKPVSIAAQTALNLKANINNPVFTGTVSGITKSMVGLASVDNTADIDKPVSTATQTALNLKADDASVVKLTGNQHISGVKIFSQEIYQNNLLLQGDSTNAYIRPTNANSTLFLGASNIGNLLSISSSSVRVETPLNVVGNIATNADIYARSINISSNLQVGGDLTLSSGNINTNKTTKITNMATFIPNYILDYSFPKTLGTTNLLAGYISVTDFQKSISLTIPLSVFRQYRNININTFTNYLEDAITSVSYVINKNNQFFTSGTCSATETLPKMVSVLTSNSTSSRNYEIYMTNVGLSFTPTYEIGTTAIYTVILNVNYRLNITDYAASNLIIENFGYYANTDQASSNIQVYSSSGSTASGAYYAPTSFTLGFVPNSYYTEGNGLVKTDSVVANTAYVRDSLTTNSLTTQKATFNDKVSFLKQVVFSEPVVLNNGVAAYHIDGLANFISTPIFCSMRSFGRPNTEDYWLVNPGFKIEIYNSNDYLVWIKTMDNTNGTAAVLYTLNDTERNRTESFRVYFLNKEVAISPLS